MKTRYNRKLPLLTDIRTAILDYEGDGVAGIPVQVYVNETDGLFELQAPECRTTITNL